MTIIQKTWPLSVVRIFSHIRTKQGGTTHSEMQHTSDIMWHPAAAAQWQASCVCSVVQLMNVHVTLKQIANKHFWSTHIAHGMDSTNALGAYYRHAELCCTKKACFMSHCHIYKLSHYWTVRVRACYYCSTMSWLTVHTMQCGSLSGTIHWYNIIKCTPTW